MPNSYIENGYLFSWFQNFGITENSYDCEKTCFNGSLSMFGLDDFYHFSQQLVERNFSVDDNGNNTNEFANFCTNVEFDFSTRSWIG